MSWLISLLMVITLQFKTFPHRLQVPSRITAQVIIAQLPAAHTTDTFQHFSDIFMALTDMAIITEQGAQHYSHCIYTSSICSK